MKDRRVFITSGNDCVPPSLCAQKGDDNALPSCRIPSLIYNEKLKAFCNRSNCGADWGFIEIVEAQSSDFGNSFEKIQTIFTPPCRKAPTSSDEYSSAFAIDPVTVVLNNGDELLLFDFFPECKGLHKAELMVSGNGYSEFNGELCRVLTNQNGEKFYVKADGFIYNENNIRTNYYLSQKHSAENSYQTLGDVYYCENEQMYLNSPPPLFPNTNGDKYAGNIFLNYDSDDFNKKLSDNSLYNAIESSGSLFSADITSYIYMMKRKKGEKYFTQPIDITPQIKGFSSEAFLGVTPGNGIVLKSGRVLIPVYEIGKAYVIYSDDMGDTWHKSEFAENIDEAQLFETDSGVVGMLGRPIVAGALPYSISFNGGISWEKRDCDIFSAKCQHSVLKVSREMYCSQMNFDKEYVIITRPTSHHGEDDSRTAGCAALCEIADDFSLNVVGEIPLKTDEIYSVSEKYHDFFAYSSMCCLPNGCFGVLFEGFPAGYISFNSYSLSNFFER